MRIVASILCLVLFSSPLLAQGQLNQNKEAAGGVDGCTIAVFVIIAGVIISVVAGIYAWFQLKREYEAARAAYYESLANLKNDPANPNIRERTLALGRTYIDAATKYVEFNKSAGGQTTFSELMLMNDINAACARVNVAQTVAETGPTAHSVKVRCPSCKALNDETVKFCGQCGAAV